MRCVHGLALSCQPTQVQPAHPGWTRPRPWFGLVRLVPGAAILCCFLSEHDEARRCIITRRIPLMILFYPTLSSAPQVIPLYRSRRCCAPPIFFFSSFAASDHALFSLPNWLGCLHSFYNETTTTTSNSYIRHRCHLVSQRTTITFDSVYHLFL